jgi:hydroxyacylglutathione hydrolase
MKQEIIRIDLEGVNCYLGKSEEGFILFDTGGHIILDKKFTNRREALVSQLDKEGCRPGNLKAIVLTHGDNDHVANAAYLREKYQTIIAMHGDDRELVDNVTLDKMMRSFHYRSLLFKIIFRLMKKQITKITAKTLQDFVSFKPDIILEEGNNLSQFGFSANIIHLPGHTPGSIGILFENGDFIAGDFFANIKKPELAQNANDFNQLRRSVEKIKSFNITSIYPGHGTPFSASKVGIADKTINANN